MYEKNIYKDILKGAVTFIVVIILMALVYLTINASIYIKKTFLTYPDSSVTQLELKVMNHEQRIRMIERWIVRNSKKK